MRLQLDEPSQVKYESSFSYFDHNFTAANKKICTSCEQKMLSFHENYQTVYCQQITLLYHSSNSAISLEFSLDGFLLHTADTNFVRD